MRRYTVYLAHPFGGNEGNREDAIRIERGLNILKDAEYVIVNPLTDEGVAKVALEVGYKEDMIRAYCGGVLQVCNLVIFCPGWEHSTGCLYEHKVAKKHGIPRIYLTKHEAAILREVATRARLEAWAA